MKDVAVIEVRIWGQRVGAVALDPTLGYYAFAYEPAWQRTGVELAFLTLPLGNRSSAFVFPSLPDATFHRLPACWQMRCPMISAMPLLMRSRTRPGSLQNADPGTREHRPRAVRRLLRSRGPINKWAQEGCLAALQGS
jgi:hypothetical protein